MYHKVLAGWFPTSSQNTGHLASQNGMESKSFKKKHTSFEITNQHIYARLLAGDIPTLVLIAYCLKQPTSTCLIHFSVAHVESTSLRKAQHMWNGFRRLDPDPSCFIAIMMGEHPNLMYAPRFKYLRELPFWGFSSFPRRIGIIGVVMSWWKMEKHSN